jgi:hypothetical protein
LGTDSILSVHIAEPKSSQFIGGSLIVIIIAVSKLGVADSTEKDLDSVEAHVVDLMVYGVDIMHLNLDARY